MNKQQYTQFNLNNNVIVTLTDEGIKYLNTKPQSEWVKVSNQKQIKIQMWAFMELFGEVTYLGMNQLYDNNIKISNTLA